MDNDNPTRLVIKAVKSEGFISGGMEFREGLPVNPLNPLEQEADRTRRVAFRYRHRVREALAGGEHIEDV